MYIHILQNKYNVLDKRATRISERPPFHTTYHLNLNT